MKLPGQLTMRRYKKLITISGMTFCETQQQSDYFEDIVRTFMSKKIPG